MGARQEACMLPADTAEAVSVDYIAKVLVSDKISICYGPVMVVI